MPAAAISVGMSTKLEPGRRYHCLQLTDGRRPTGVFCCDPNSMGVKLLDYEEFFHLEEGAPVYLRLEDNLVVSMLDTVASGPGHSSYLWEPQATTYFAEISANMVVSGHKPWQPANPIRRVMFRVPHAKALLYNRDRLRAAQGRRFPPKAASDPLFEVTVAGMVFKCWYSLSGSFEFGTNDWEPLFETEFDEPRTLKTYLDPVHSLLQFLSAGAGFQLTPKDKTISPQSHAEWLAGIEEDKHTDENYSVEYHWKPAEVEKHDLHVRNSFFMAYKAADLVAPEGCLRAWLSRDDDWAKATALMMGSLGMVRQVSGQRLLMACRWLEAIPGGRAERALDDIQLAVILKAAEEAAQAQGCRDLGRRIAGSLRSIKRESNEARLLRLVGLVVAVFGTKAFEPLPSGRNIVSTLVRAMRFRGQEAHSYIEGADRGEVADLMASTAALEALCYLLTLKDLPIDEAGRDRALHSRMVRTYHYSEMAFPSVTD